MRGDVRHEHVEIIVNIIYINMVVGNATNNDTRNLLQQVENAEQQVKVLQRAHEEKVTSGKVNWTAHATLKFKVDTEMQDWPSLCEDLYSKK